MLLACGLGSAYAAEPVHRLAIVEHDSSYVVDGISLEELRRQLDERRPPRRSTNWHGLTEVQLDTRIELATGDEGCGFARLDVEVEITILLPRWRPRQSVSRQLQDRWHAMLAGLKRHEEGHRRHVRDAAEQLYRRLLELPRGPVCGDFEARARGEITRAMVRLELKSNSYDAFTRFGERQGAEL